MIHEKWTRRHTWMYSCTQNEYDAIGAMIRLLRAAVPLVALGNWIIPADAIAWELEVEELLKEGGPDE
jgi:hypothetical protein